MASSKVKYGLTNVYYSVLTPGENADTYATPVRIPGAVSMSMEAQGDLSKFYADNGVYWQAASNQGYEGDWEFAKLPEDFRTAVLGEVKGQNDIVAEYDNVEGKQFAILFEFAGDAAHTRYCFYNCTATRPSVAGETTNDTLEPTTESITISAVGNRNHIVKGFCEESDSVYADWFTSVTLPT